MVARACCIWCFCPFQQHILWCFINTWDVTDGTTTIGFKHCDAYPFNGCIHEEIWLCTRGIKQDYGRLLDASVWLPGCNDCNKSGGSSHIVNLAHWKISWDLVVETVYSEQPLIFPNFLVQLHGMPQDSGSKKELSVTCRQSRPKPCQQMTGRGRPPKKNNMSCLPTCSPDITHIYPYYPIFGYKGNLCISIFSIYIYIHT